MVANVLIRSCKWYLMSLFLVPPLSTYLNQFSLNVMDRIDFLIERKQFYEVL